MLGGSAFIVGLSGSTYYYANAIEPFWLHIQRETIQSDLIPKAFNDFKIIQFSDTHIGFHYHLAAFKELVQQINALSPDLIVFTGDLVDDPDSFNWSNDLTDALQQLQAPSGKYWVYGNHDHGGYGTDIVKRVMSDAQFTLLQNEHTVINQQDESFILAGVDDMILGNPNLMQALQGSNSENFTVLLAHEPDFAENVKDSSVHVQLSGHSHGGQIRLPFIGHLYTPIYAKKYIHGTYHFPNDHFSLYVNKGVGTTRMPFRFFCRPEIHVFTLKSGKTQEDSGDM